MRNAGLKPVSYLPAVCSTPLRLEWSRVDLIIPQDGGKWIVGKVIDRLPFLQVFVHDGAHVPRQNVAVENPFGKDLHHRRPQTLAETRRRVDMYAVTHLLPLYLLLELGQNAPTLLVGAR